MKLPIYIVDAFAAEPFQGNPAAICPLPEWLPDATLQAIAAQNNLSETAYFVPGEAPQTLRWFTPTCEVQLCGHATLASAFTAWEKLGFPAEPIRFATRSGMVAVHQTDRGPELDFPSEPGAPTALTDALCASLGATPEHVVLGKCPFAIFGSEAEIRGLKPDFAAFTAHGIIAAGVTAPGTDVDFVSRYFAPGAGVPEDPVTGSAHCTLIPYWAARLGKNRLTARQVSARGGELNVALRGDRVGIGGQCRLYLEGTIDIG